MKIAYLLHSSALVDSADKPRTLLKALFCLTAHFSCFLSLINHVYAVSIVA